MAPSHRARPWSRLLVLALCAWAALGAPAAAQDEEALEVAGTRAHPLEPPDTSSPRATFQSFLTDANAAWRAYLRRRAGEAERGAALRYVQRAARCLDLRQVPPAQRDDVGLQTMVLLLDVFNRIQIPSPQYVPDAEAMESEGQLRWTVPHTRITIARVEDGPRAGEWLFTPETVEGAREFYRRTRDIPLKPGAVIEDGYEIYVALTGWMIPVAWVEALPEWAQQAYFDQTVWQWCLLVVVLLLAGLLMRLCLHWSRGLAQRERRSSWRALVAPVSLMLIAAGALYLIHEQINITGSLLLFLQVLLDSIFYLAAAWAIILAGGVLGQTVLSSPRIRRDSVDTHLIRVGTRLASIAVAIFVVAQGAHSLGVPVVGVVAGLGVGGLAIALAAQPTIENFIGGLTLFADRPVRVGDFCRFGTQLGTVEEIGLRSTRIRTLERSVLSVPNADFSRLQLDNLTLRDRILFRTTLNLRLETTAAQLERVLASVREILLGDEAVDEDPARVRVVAVGPYSLDLEIFAYVKTSDWNEFLRLREGLFVRILRAIEEAGTALAPPARTTYLRSANELAAAPDASAGAPRERPA